jgi:hypothetical protein
MIRSGFCKICGKKFITESEEEENVLIETVKKFWNPVICDDCKKQIRNKRK